MQGFAPFTQVIRHLADAYADSRRELQTPHLVLTSVVELPQVMHDVYTFLHQQGTDYFAIEI